MRQTVLTMLLAAGLCGCDAPPVGRSCDYNGQAYPSGATFPSGDGCNTCGCQDGQVMCTARACAGDGGADQDMASGGGDQDMSSGGGDDGGAGPKACEFEGGRYQSGESFPADDGCNTCNCTAPPPSVGCTKRGCQALEWLSFYPVQCRMNPWEQMKPKGDGKNPSYPIPELLTIDNYFEDQGIDIKEIGLLDSYVGTCGACNCARGDRLLVRATVADATKLRAMFGFKPLGANELYTFKPRRCAGQNPWADPMKPDPHEDAKNVSIWATTLSADLKEAGFVYLTADPLAACTSCGCPRGERLFVQPRQDAAGATLRKEGFLSPP